MKVKASFGCANEIVKDFPAGTTVGQLRNDRNVRAVLGYGDNVVFLIDGTEQPDNAPLSEGDVVTITTKAASKAA